jgi:hypothetical protein
MDRRDILEKAARGGFNMNGRNNGLDLPHPHTKPKLNLYDHPRYNNAVPNMLLQLPPNLTDAQTAHAVQGIADRLGRSLQRIANASGGRVNLA